MAKKQSCKRIGKMILCVSLLLIVGMPTVFGADWTIEENAGQVDLNPANALNKTQNYWTRYYWDGSNMVSTTYTATLNSSATLKANVEANNTATNMKSGYGYTLNIDSTVASSKGTLGVPDVDASKTMASIQNMNVYFPEFNYDKGVTYNSVKQTFNRLGQVGSNTASGKDAISLVTFKPNPFSANNSLVHFTPFWFPDKTQYTPFVEAFDAWTPAGMLGTTLTPSIQVNGQVYDDWHIAPITAAQAGN